MRYFKGIFFCCFLVSKDNINNTNIFVQTPLKNMSVDIVVFCLSLMGTNYEQFLREANRVLKEGYRARGPVLIGDIIL